MTKDNAREQCVDTFIFQYLVLSPNELPGIGSDVLVVEVLATLLLDPSVTLVVALAKLVEVVNGIGVGLGPWTAVTAIRNGHVGEWARNYLLGHSHQCWRRSDRPFCWRSLTWVITIKNI